MKNELITPAIFRMICRKQGRSDPELISNLINTICPLYGMSKLILHEFLANVLYESDEFTRYEENLHYSASRLVQVWPLRFRTIQEALPYANNPQKLAVKVYGGRMGNTDPMDGWDFRGSGPIQMTGKDNFTQFASWMDRKFNITRTEREWAQLLRKDDEAGLHAACWIFSIAKGLNDEAIRDEMRFIIKKINGGYNGLDERMKYYEACKRFLR
ncbi:MAG: hypothetical protein J7578_22815 [Chitinophagaceae bacterium]|nr:hypothetical protein [Chitinophagaceae bacterium]